MALDISGIRNVEFYSEHYLEAVLESDLKGVFSRWADEKKEKGTPQPHEALLRQSNPYFKAAAKAESERDLTTRWEVAREFHAGLLEVLGYPYRPSAELLSNNEFCPVLLALEKDGNPYLWVVDAPFTEEEDDDPFEAYPLTEQLPKNLQDARLPHENSRAPLNWREIFDSRIFRSELTPKWVLFLAGREVYLVERNKWPQGRYLAFNLAEIFRRNQAAALKATAGLLHRDVLAPDTGLCLHDTLDENSHKHAYAVSSDLKYGVRRAVELLGNEAIYYRREVQKQGVFDSEDFAAELLTRECLTWLYRLLFLFYVEARGGELGIVPMNAEIYRNGYSLENLRDLEMVELSTDHARNGFYLHDSLRTLFRLVNEGYGVEQGSRSLDLERVMHDSMVLQPLNSPLFDNERFRILRTIRIRNFVLQEILQLLSLSAEKKRKTRGRISYAQLGINQLGAVYEGLLSYTGFFAQEDMYEAAAEKDCTQLSGKSAAEREALKTYFVPASKIADYKESEIVKNERGRKVIHPKGTFIFRLAGRNREKSASYYTPEVLTKCLVKYALKELLWQEGEEGEKPKRKKTADEILALTICEPAMGSSAFLIEAVDQLADAYLEARQGELGETIPPEDYQREKRRVKARLATNNCYGVDLNPTAVELAKVSLWLATLYEGGKCPWFGLRLATGNSLVGARREVFRVADVTRRDTKNNPNWLGLVPEPVSLYHGEAGPPIDEHWTPPPRPKGTIYHFLLPAEGMAAFDKDKVIKELAPESVKRIKEWRREFCKPFNKADAERLEQISDAVDRLFAQVVRERVLATQETSDRIPVWGENTNDERSAQQADLLVHDQEEVAASLEDRSSAYRRLKLAMDAWCALWFWPIEEAGLLPDRATWLAQMELILKGQVTHEEVWHQQNLFGALAAECQGEAVTSKGKLGGVGPPHKGSADRLKLLKTLSDGFRERRADYFEECGLADIDAALKGDASLGAVQALADRLHFHHWPLRFAEVFATRGGFDLILGNPPWVKLRWLEASVLSDYNPKVEIRKVSASDAYEFRAAVLSQTSARMAYSEEFVELEGTQSYLNADQNYSVLKGIQTNLYKCFITRAWANGNEAGIAAFLHPEGVYDDPKGGRLRAAAYPRLTAHFQFINELRLFPVDHHVKFSVNTYRSRESQRVYFLHASSLFHPATLDGSVSHDGLGSVPGIKNSENQWDLLPHRNRIVWVGNERLALFAALYDEPGTPALQASLPVVHSEEIVRVLESFARQPRRLGDLANQYVASDMWHETNAQKDGTIRSETRYPSDVSGWIIQGPHFYVGNPLAKTPNDPCRHNQDYAEIDLEAIPEDYLPRTNYVPSCEPDEYVRRMPKWNGDPITSLYRHVHRRFANPTNERTLIGALFPPGPGHINVCTSITSGDNYLLASLAGMTSSIPYDFMIKSTGSGNLYESVLAKLPFPDDRHTVSLLVHRAAMLSCLTKSYADLWDSLLKNYPTDDSPCSSDVRLATWGRNDDGWHTKVALRSDLERRQALVEVDVLAALALGIELGELLTIYRVQFPILQNYEREKLHDQNGRIVPTSKTASGSPAVNLVELAATLKEQAGFDVHAEYHPDASNTQELRKQKIRLGKKEADVLGVSERCTMADLLAETSVRWSDEDHPEGRPVRLVGLRYTDPGLEPRMERVYPTPWTRCDREADYRQAWAEFERRLEKKMPEGTPL